MGLQRLAVRNSSGPGAATTQPAVMLGTRL